MIELGHSLDLLAPTLHNGPGWRIPIWTQGCSLRCTDDCLSPHLLTKGMGRSFPCSEVSAAIIKAAGEATVPVEGITVLGGEPTDQAEALLNILMDVRRAGLSVMLYSGRKLKWLMHCKSDPITRLLDIVDILVDGPFIEKKYSHTAMWKGSSNQNIIIMSDRYSYYGIQRQWNSQKKSFSITSSPSGRLVVSGLQCRDGAHGISEMLLMARGKHRPNEFSG